MAEIIQIGDRVADNRLLLAYVQHMARTAQSAAAKYLFALFAQQETCRIEANGGSQFSASKNGIGVARMSPAPASAGRPARMKRSGSRIGRTETIWRKPDTAGGETMKKSAGKKVNFQVTAEPGSEVFVAGSFNNWNSTQHQMRGNPGSGHCEITISLPPGRHEYKFLVNGEWRTDLNCAESAQNDQGSLNSVIVV